METLLLDRTTWDLLLDANGDIAKASEPYSVVQDVASAIKLFKTELWYNKAKGLPYFQDILGQHPSLVFLKSQIERAAKTVPTVKAASCIISTFTGRQLAGTVIVTTDTGRVFNANF